MEPNGQISVIRRDRGEVEQALQQALI